MLQVFLERLDIRKVLLDLAVDLVDNGTTVVAMLEGKKRRGNPTSVPHELLAARQQVQHACISCDLPEPCMNDTVNGCENHAAPSGCKRGRATCNVI